MDVPLKLMVSKEKNKVVFAEAGKDFVDVLFSFLTLPLGTIVRLVGKEESEMQPVKVGSLTSLYGSVANLDKEYLCTDTCKEMLLRPRNSMEDYCKNMKLNIDDTQPTRYFVCDNLVNCRRKARVEVSTFQNKRCSCGDLLAKQILPKSSNVCNGFIKGNMAFLITDDLKIVPNSLDTMFSLLKDCGIDNLPAVEEMNVNVTKKQVLGLLKNCLLSKTTLTDVFLEKKLAFEGFEQPRPLCDFAAKGSSQQIDVKVVQRKSDGKIVFAQGKEDFMDFLCSFLTFPLGGVIHLLEGYSSMGSIDGLYESIVGLSDDYLTSKEVKDKLVFPRLAPQFKLSNQIIPIDESDAPRYFCYTNSYKSRKRRIILSDYYLTSTCRGDSNNSFETCNALDMVDPISKRGSAKGLAKGPTMYVATDDLIVTPMSSISIMSLLNSKSIPIGDLEEKMVSIGIKEGLRILKASLTSSSALTNGLSHLLTKVKEEK